MKKLLLSVAVFGMITAVNAQDDKVYTPVSGDWAVGVDATPFLNYFGNFIGGNGLNTAPSWNFQTTNQTITGKYFVADDMAYRGSLRIGFGSTTANQMVTDLADTATNNNLTFPELQSMTENTAKWSGSFFGLSGGIEKRKGTGRLQGFYGGELGFSISSSKAAYTYGNALTVGNGDTTIFVPVTGADDFGGNLTADTYGNAARVTEMKSGSTFTFGLRGFIGAEYFVLPKMSIGGEFGWGLGLSTTGASSYTTESIGGNDNFTAFGTEKLSVETQTIEGSKSKGFSLDTDNRNSMFGASGAIKLTLYF